MNVKLLTTTEGNRCYQREYNGKTILAQVNRLGIWHGYVNCKYKITFTSEVDAKTWVQEYPLAEFD